jgi:hypothetical protein
MIQLIKLKRPIALLPLFLILISCTSSNKRPDVGACIRKDNTNYRENVYMVQTWEADGTPQVKDLVSGKVKNLLDYEPGLYRTTDCPK